MGDYVRNKQEKRGTKIYKPNQYDRRKDNHFNDNRRRFQDQRNFKNNPNFKAVPIKEKKPKITEEQKQAQLDKELDRYFNKDRKVIRGFQTAETGQPARAIQKADCRGELIKYLKYKWLQSGK